jgi:serine/threonine-protein kinase
MTAIGNRYRKTGGAGAGPLGALHRGRDENAERDVYIEELPLSITLAVPPLVLTRLEHPNILKLYEHVVDSTKNYLITELVEGKSLEQMLSERGGALSSFEAIAIMDQICVGLAYAHQHGVFHRNIRPACIWISGRTAKLTSFGITLGRPTPYQAPELATGGDPDVRSDLYSVGITLVQLLTGAAPGGNIDLPTDLPRSLGGMIRKMISREPMIRPTNIKLVRDAMASVL